MADVLDRDAADGGTSEAAARILRWTDRDAAEPRIEPDAPAPPPLAERVASVSRSLGRLAARLGEHGDE